MPLRVSGKNVDLGEALRLKITQRIEESVAKFCAPKDRATRRIVSCTCPLALRSTR